MELRDGKPLAFVAFLGEDLGISMDGRPKISQPNDLVGERSCTRIVATVAFFWCEASKVEEAETALV